MKSFAVKLSGIFAFAFLYFSGINAAFADQPRRIVIQKASVSATAASGVASGATSTVSVTAPGAKVGDACVASTSVDATGFALGCVVTAADTAKVTITQLTTNGAALSSGTLRVFIFPKGTE